MSAVLVAGANAHGQLGCGVSRDRKVFERLPLPQDHIITEFALGENHTLRIDVEGQVWSYGKGDGGQLGHGDNKSYDRPKLLESPLVKNVVHIAVGSDHSLFVTRDGRVLSCGRGACGQLGHGSVDSSISPKLIEALEHTKIVSVAAGDDHSVFIDENGCAFACGLGSNGQLGMGVTQNQLLPKPILIDDVGKPPKFVRAEAGGSHTLLLTDDGHVYACGWNEFGQCGVDAPNDLLVPTRIESLVAFKVSAFAAGSTHSVFVNALGLVYTCGFGQFGRLGHNDESHRPIPTPIASLAKIKILGCGAGRDHTVLIDQRQCVYSFGWGQYGAVGDSVTRLKPRVVKVTTKRREVIVGLFAGGNQTAILLGQKSLSTKSTPKGWWNCMY